MKILFPALRVSDLDTSLAFYSSVGLEAIGQVTSDVGTPMSMLAWPCDEVSLELVARTDAVPVVLGAFDHLEIQVDDLDATRRDLVAAGHRLELVQWPAGHPVGMTRGDFDPVTPIRGKAPSARSNKETQR